MTVICAWCKKIKQPDNSFAVGHPPANTKISHGICRECAAATKQKTRMGGINENATGPDLGNALQRNSAEGCKNTSNATHCRIYTGTTLAHRYFASEFHDRLHGRAGARD
jgi:hypothetical protein